MQRLIYKIADRGEFEAAMATGLFHGAAVDRADGFIHFSNAAQLRETGRRHFAGRDDLVLAAIDATLLGDALRHEKSRGGDLFPHLYGPLPAAAVVWVTPLQRDAGGALTFPGDIP